MPLLGKYRSLSSAVDLCRALDILENKRLYLSPVAALNDPLEGRGLSYHINGHAGMSILINAGYLPAPVKESIERHEVLCLTSNCASPQMWVHYADGFRGVCICMKKNGTLSLAEKVEYCSRTKNSSAGVIASGEELDSLTHQGLLIKQDEWAYEHEYRIVQQPCDDKGSHYWRLAQDDIAAVIIGHCAEKEVADLIRRTCGRLCIPLYRTHIREMSEQIEIVPDGFKVEFAGETFDNQLKRYYGRHSVKPFASLRDE